MRTKPIEIDRNGSGQSERVADQVVSLRAPTSFEADQYRTLRHAVERLHRDAGLQVVGITSPRSGDGKSITAVNLAAALAQSHDARVLIVDADLRGPSVAEYLGLGRVISPGLADAIEDATCDLTQVVRFLHGFNLAVLPAGAPQASPYELLNSPRLETLLTEARRRYDFVLIDTPPLLPFPDCRVLTRFVDGFLVIVAAHRTPRKLVNEALSLIDRSKLSGVVFNGDDQPVSSGYGYSEYYSARGRDRQGDWLRGH